MGTGFDRLWIGYKRKGKSAYPLLVLVVYLKSIPLFDTTLKKLKHLLFIKMKGFGDDIMFLFIPCQAKTQH